MGLETRGGGGVYYNRKRRFGGSVVSEYVGAGEMALLAYAHAKREKAERKAALKRQRIERMKVEATDKVLAKLSDALDTLVKASLEVDGYHQHKGEWRRRRDEKR